MNSPHLENAINENENFSACQKALDDKTIICNFLI